MDSEKEQKSFIEEVFGPLKLGAGELFVLRASTSTLAPLGERAGAYMMDKLIIMLGSTFFLQPVFSVFGVYDQLGYAPLLTLLTSVLAEFGYAGYFYSNFRATPGKMIFGLQVVGESGNQLKFLEAGLRDGMGKMVSWLVLGIGYFIAFSRPDRQALHDLMFKTKVVLAAREPEIGGGEDAI